MEIISNQGGREGESVGIRKHGDMTADLREKINTDMTGERDKVD